MCGAQALDFHRPLVPGKGAAAARDAVRATVPFIQQDTVLTGFIASLEARTASGDIMRAVESAAGQLLRGDD
jgi:histidine ammonia-lyase